MNTQRFLLIFALLTSLQLCASNLPQVCVNLSPGPSTPFDCEAPPPLDFHVEEMGTTWAKLGWTLTELQHQHRVRIYRASDNFLLNTTTVPAGLSSVIISNLQTSIPFYGTISTICDDGSEGPDNRFGPTSLILDIIVSGYTNNNTHSDCMISSAGGQCNFPAGTTTPFWIKDVNGGGARKFGLQLIVIINNNTTEIHLAVNLYDYNTSQLMKFYCSSGSGPNCYNTAQVIIKKEMTPGKEVTIATLDITGGISTGTITGTVSSGYLIELLGPQPSFNPNAGNNKQSGPYSDVSAAPNPFSNALDVFVGNPDAQKIQLQMFDLSGRAVLDQQFVGGQDQYSLPTETLSPGFYFLRIDVDGNVQTLKVAKSE